IRDSKSLTREQAAFLAALLPDPKYYQDHRNDRKLQYRKRVILRYMNSTQIPE
ncbi:transglycosylase domain-containing protein, partial [Acinetobacter baumannii]